MICRKDKLAPGRIACYADKTMPHVRQLTWSVELLHWWGQWINVNAQARNEAATIPVLKDHFNL